MGKPKARKNPHKGKPIQIYLPAGQIEALDREARDRGAPWTRTSVLRDLIARHVQQLKLAGVD